MPYLVAEISGLPSSAQCLCEVPLTCGGPRRAYKRPTHHARLFRLTDADR